ncbi:hypothetical protein GX586_13935 [bacterium]|nr:hypothetical protein [bacterium]
MNALVPRLSSARRAAFAAAAALALALAASIPASGAVAPGVMVESRDYITVAFSGSIALAQLVLTNNYRISSPTDARYATPLKPLRASRRSQLLAFPKYPNYALSNICGQWASMQLPHTLLHGHVYTVTVLNVAGPSTAAGFRFDETNGLNHNIKVNQVGYYPRSSAKYGYLGGYLGSQRGLPLDFATTAYVCQADSGEPVYAAPVTLRADQNKGYTNPSYTEWQMSGENVYQFDFSPVTNEGRYYVFVPGLGRSHPFVIDAGVFWHVFTNVAHAVYLQRCGIEVNDAYSTVFKHKMCHTQAMEMTTSSNIDGFITPGTGIDKFLSVRGGYHDAGDYDRRVYHISVARSMLDLYAMLRNKLTDGQLHVPEEGNGVPDVLDEVWWGLRVWLELQDPADGGIRGGTERLAEGGMDEKVDNLKLDYYVFGKYLVNGNGVVQASAWFAAAAAQLAREILPFDPARAQAALDAAKRAYAYALAHGAAGDDKSDAAAELFCTTGGGVYHQDFLGTGVRKSFSYATSPLPGLDASARTYCRSYWLSRAGDAMTWVNGGGSYRCARNPYSPIRFGGGTGGHGNTFDLCRGFSLTGNSNYLVSVHHDSNFVLGCNPLGRSWITGLGALTPEFFLHRQLIIDGRTNIPPGYHIYGPFAKSSNSASYGTHYEAFWTNLYPATLSYPRMRAYVASEWMAGMNEFTITETMAPSYCVFSFSHLVEQPDPPAPPDSRPPGILVIDPAPGAMVTSATPVVTLRVEDNRAVDAVWIEGQLTAGTTFYTRTAVIGEGPTVLTAIARDAAGNVSTAAWTVTGTIPEPWPLGMAAAALLSAARMARRHSRA